MVKNKRELNLIKTKIRTLKNEVDEILSSYPVAIEKTDELHMDYFLLPVGTTVLQFLYRFSKPIPTVWSYGEIKDAYSIMANGDLKTELELFARTTYLEMISQEEVKSNKSIAQQIFWLKYLDKVKIFECEVLRKDNK